ncbi:hypothetical protein KKH14_00540 [Patescibacteria group bacterium]|nr:hypothetical protein [Patescibacteria group bacterium]
MKRFLVLIKLLLIVLVAFGMLGCATTGALTPLPKALNITNPDPSIGEIAKCSGIWRGRWDNTYFQATTIVLEKIGRTEVIAVYAWEAYRDSPGGWIRVSGKIINSSTIVLEWGEKERRRIVTLTLVGNELKAEYRRVNESYINYATLTKAQ